MARQSSNASHDTEDVPGPVRSYFAADATRDIDAILALFTPDASVVDEGQTYRGAEMRREWQDGPGSRYQYRVTIVDHRELADGCVRVVGRLDGNFPGGMATVNFDFELAGERIAGLAIAP